MKTHSCHALLQRIILAGLRRLVQADVYEAVIDVMEHLKKEIPLILSKLEKIVHPAFFDVIVHLAVHLPNEACNIP